MRSFVVGAGSFFDRREIVNLFKTCKATLLSPCSMQHSNVFATLINKRGGDYCFFCCLLREVVARVNEKHSFSFHISQQLFLSRVSEGHRQPRVVAIARDTLAYFSRGRTVFTLRLCCSHCSLSTRSLSRSPYPSPVSLFPSLS